VGGWLLFFCVQLVILAPGFVLMNVLTTAALISKVGAMTPIGVCLSVDSIARLLIAGAGVYIGSLLWRGQRAGVTLIRPYLIVFPGLHLLLACLPFVFPFARDIQVALAQPHVIGRSCQSRAAWYGGSILETPDESERLMGWSQL
jgi:hypothetical protein